MSSYSEAQLGKVLVWVLVVLGVMIVMRILSQKKHKARQSPQLHKRPAKSTESMVRCAHCGIYLPRSEALMSNHHTWCSLEHAKLGPRN